MSALQPPSELEGIGNLHGSAENSDSTKQVCHVDWAPKLQPITTKATVWTRGFVILAVPRAAACCEVETAVQRLLHP